MSRDSAGYASCGDPCKIQNKHQLIDSCRFDSVSSFDLFSEPEPHTIDKRKAAEFEPISNFNALDAKASPVANPDRTQVSRDRQVAGQHYQTEQGIQPWDVIEAFGLDFYKGNALKYLLRAGRKENVPALDDLRKCAHYLERIIELEEGKS